MNSVEGMTQLSPEQTIEIHLQDLHKLQAHNNHLQKEVAHWKTELERTESYIRRLEATIKARDEKISSLEATTKDLLEQTDSLNEEIYQLKDGKRSHDAIRREQQQSEATKDTPSHGCRNQCLDIVSHLQNVSRVQREMLDKLANLPTKQDFDCMRPETEGKKSESSGWKEWLGLKETAAKKIQCDSCEELKKNIHGLKEQLQRQGERANDVFSRYQGGKISREEVLQRFKSFFDFPPTSTTESSMKHQNQISKEFCDAFMVVYGSVRQEILNKIYWSFSNILNDPQSADEDVCRAFSILMPKICLEEKTYREMQCHFKKFKATSTDYVMEAIDLSSSLLLHVPPIIPTTIPTFDEKFHRQASGRKHPMKNGQDVMHLSPTLINAQGIISCGKVCARLHTKINIDFTTDCH